MYEFRITSRSISISITRSTHVPVHVEVFSFCVTCRSLDYFVHVLSLELWNCLISTFVQVLVLPIFNFKNQTFFNVGAG